MKTALRTHTNGELRISNCTQEVTLCGWVHKNREMGGMSFIDLRDRYGITQLVLSRDTSDAALYEMAAGLGRESVIQVKGIVRERENKNKNIPTGDIEIMVQHIDMLNASLLPPFTIEDNSDGGDDIRMKYRYLDIRRNPVKNNLLLRHQMAKQTRHYMDSLAFVEVETPVLIKSTPEGARDFVVPSRMNQGQYYALPQSPQTFKQLLMVAGMDRYYQIVKCFRDEDLRADRQPEFTQIDCEMSFIEQEDILQTFEGLVKHLFQSVKGIDVADFPRMSYADAMIYYGSDKPDTRFDMRFVELKNTSIRPSDSQHRNDVVSNKGFKLFDEAAYVGCICVKGAAEYTRKQLDELTEFVKRPQIGASGLIYLRVNADGSLKSSVDKFYSENDLRLWADACHAQAGDLILVIAGGIDSSRNALSELRLEMGSRMGLRNPNTFSCLWVLDFPLLEYIEEDKRWFAKHHPFTSPKPEDFHLIDAMMEGKTEGQSTEQIAVPRANAYDMVINGVEVGGGSIRIFDKTLQAKMFRLLGFTPEQAQAQFGFLMNAFEYGAPPHGGIAFGFDRLCSLFGGENSIRDFIAFPKNNSGKDVMIDAPSDIDDKQKQELGIRNL